MLKYADYHFKSEEGLLEKYDYNETKQHKALHLDFFEKTKLYLADQEAGKNRVHYDLMKYLKDWLLIHIQGDDLKYVDYFKAKGIKIQ